MIELQNKEALHKKYLAIYYAHRLDPEFFPLVQSNTELTTVMGGRPWSWHVIGITPAALKKYEENNFRPQPKSGITRAHLVPRYETTQKLMTCDQPYKVDDFFDFWFANDKTVICAAGENKVIKDIDFISINNDSFTYFKSATIGWRFKVHNEGKFLRKLWEHQLS